MGSRAAAAAHRLVDEYQRLGDLHRRTQLTQARLRLEVRLRHEGEHRHRRALRRAQLARQLKNRLTNPPGEMRAVLQYRKRYVRRVSSWVWVARGGYDVLIKLGDIIEVVHVEEDLGHWQVQLEQRADLGDL